MKKNDVKVGAVVYFFQVGQTTVGELPGNRKGVVISEPVATAHSRTSRTYYSEILFDDRSIPETVNVQRLSATEGSGRW